MGSPSQSDSQPGSWFEFGTLARTHGIRGEVRLVPSDPDTPFPETARKVRVRPRRGAPVILTVASLRPIHGAYLISFEEERQREALMIYNGAALEIAAADLPPPPEGEVYLFEIVGAQAVDEAGRELGTVHQVVDNNGQDLLVLQPGERLLPLAGDVLVRFERAHKRVVLRVPEGLWD